MAKKKSTRTTHKRKSATCEMCGCSMTRKKTRRK